MERKVALGARTHLEIDIMNTKYADGYKIVSEDEQALAFLEDWIAFAAELERSYGLAPRAHDLRADPRRATSWTRTRTAAATSCSTAWHLIWKRCHSWGNVIGEHHVDPAAADSFGSPARARQRGAAALGSHRDTYCPAPYDQFVIQWNGDVVTCCTDYEGRTKTANVFASSIEDIWKSETLQPAQAGHARGPAARRLREVHGAQVTQAAASMTDLLAARSQMAMSLAFHIVFAVVGHRPCRC